MHTSGVQKMILGVMWCNIHDWPIFAL